MNVSTQPRTATAVNGLEILHDQAHHEQEMKNWVWTFYDLIGISLPW